MRVRMRMLLPTKKGNKTRMFYVVQVKSHQEEATISQIRQRVPESLIHDIFTPKYTTNIKVRGEFIQTVKNCFPGYIFIETDDPTEVFKRLYFVPAFTKLLGKSSENETFVPLNELEERMIKILYNKEDNHTTKISEVRFEEGMKIIVLSGPLLGQESYIKKIDLHKRIATIPITVCGRSCDVKLGFDIISEKFN